MRPFVTLSHPALRYSILIAGALAGALAVGDAEEQV